MRLRTVTLIGAVLVLAGAISSSTHAAHVWSVYHWARMANPFTLLVVDSVTPDWQAELDDSLAEWSWSEVLDAAATSWDDSNKARKRCRMVKGQIRACNAAYGFNGWLGMATIGINSAGHIDRGTAKVNDSYSSYWTIPGEKNHVMCQEIGHLFGLGHTSTNGTSQGTCMDYSSDPASQWPNDHDFEQLAVIYGDHLDDYNSYDDGTVEVLNEGCNAPPGKGCNKNNGAIPLGVLVHHDRNHELWVAPRRDGGLWVHHIRLAPDVH